MNALIRPLFLALLCLLAGGCATIVKDDNQPVAFSTDPQGAIVALNGIPRGTTPVTLMIERTRKKQMIEVTKDGYKTVQLPLEKHVAGMTFGNIIFGGLIGFGVDYFSGKGSNYQDAVLIKLIALPKPPAEVAPGAPSATPVIVNNGLGLTVAVESGHVIVKVVLPNSAGTAAGIAPGDEILDFSQEPAVSGVEAATAAINAPKVQTALVTWRTGTTQPKTARLDW
jgi:hypothetical protein